LKEKNRAALRVHGAFRGMNLQRERTLFITVCACGETERREGKNRKKEITKIRLF